MIPLASFYQVERHGTHSCSIYITPKPPLIVYTKNSKGMKLTRTSAVLLMSWAAAATTAAPMTRPRTSESPSSVAAAPLNETPAFDRRRSRATLGRGENSLPGLQESEGSTADVVKGGRQFSRGEGVSDWGLVDEHTRRDVKRDGEGEASGSVRVEDGWGSDWPGAR
jgi:hypothetical protein